MTMCPQPCASERGNHLQAEPARLILLLTPQQSPLPQSRLHKLRSTIFTILLPFGVSLGIDGHVFRDVDLTEFWRKLLGAEVDPFDVCDYVSDGFGLVGADVLHMVTGYLGVAFEELVDD
jgi:hypothetical protein